MAESELKKGHRITEVYAFVVVDDEDEEGIPAIAGPGGTLYPLIASDEVRLRYYRELIPDIARAMGKEVKLVRFSNREEIEVIRPTEEPDRSADDAGGLRDYGGEM